MRSVSGWRHGRRCCLPAAVPISRTISCSSITSSWDEQPHTSGAVFIALLLVAIFLTWPILIGPPVLVVVSLALGRDAPPREPAVLGNPRASERMIEIDRYDPRAAAGPWITSAGRSYAIADLRLLPDEVRSRVDVIAQYGRAVVIRRRDATMMGCD